MNDPNELKGLREKHADVFSNQTVDNVVNWREPILGDGRPETQKSKKDFKKIVKILADKSN